MTRLPCESNIPHTQTYWNASLTCETFFDQYTLNWLKDMFSICKRNSPHGDTNLTYIPINITFIKATLPPPPPPPPPQQLKETLIQRKLLQSSGKYKHYRTYTILEHTSKWLVLILQSLRIGQVITEHCCSCRSCVIRWYTTICNVQVSICIH